MFLRRPKIFEKISQLMSSMMGDFFKSCGLLRISKLYLHRNGRETANCEFLKFDFNSLLLLKQFLD